jgi:hypothetical protein
MLLPGGGDIAQISFAQGCGGIAIFFPEMTNSPGVARGGALLELTDT